VKYHPIFQRRILWADELQAIVRRKGRFRIQGFYMDDWCGQATLDSPPTVDVRRSVGLEGVATEYFWFKLVRIMGVRR